MYHAAFKNNFHYINAIANKIFKLNLFADVTDVKYLPNKARR